MAYKKILVDNLICSRRFHISFDDEGERSDKVELKCLHCGIAVFVQRDHPAARLVRDENLIKETELSPYRAYDCAFKDTFSPPEKPKT